MSEIDNFAKNLCKNSCFFKFFAPPLIWSRSAENGYFFRKLDIRLEYPVTTEFENHWILYDENQSPAWWSKCYKHDTLWTCHNPIYKTKRAKFLYTTVFGHEESESDRLFDHKNFFHYSNNWSLLSCFLAGKMSKKFQISKILAFSDSSHRKTVVYQKSAHSELPGAGKWYLQILELIHVCKNVIYREIHSPHSRMLGMS